MRNGTGLSPETAQYFLSVQHNLPFTEQVHDLILSISSPQGQLHVNGQKNRKKEASLPFMIKKAQVLLF